MTYCIECGAKAPVAAKFCPKCGFSLVTAEAEDVQEPPVSEATESDAEDVVLSEAHSSAPEPEEAVSHDEISAEETEKEIPELEPQDPVHDPAPEPVSAPEEALQEAAAPTVQTPKSKTGLFIGLSLIALLVAGGGAYGLGMFGGGAPEETHIADRSRIRAPAKPKSKTSRKEEKPTTEAATLAAYQAAIKSGKISDLGEFATAHANSSLAKDAEAAAFISLERQKSVLAFSLFTKYFPEADVSAYTGPRTNADSESRPPQEVVIELAAPTFSEAASPTSVQTDPDVLTLPVIRPSVATRIEELDPFIAQGDIGYALSVIDELQAVPDLTASEITYLLNVRAKVEAAQNFSLPASDVQSPEPAPIQETPVIETAAKTSPDSPSAVEVIEPKVPVFDIAAKPIERFGAITPHYVTEPGECDMTFSINPSGTPTNIVPKCTDEVFNIPAEEAVAAWVYSPATLAGQPVQQDGLVVKLKFHLEDIE